MTERLWICLLLAVCAGCGGGTQLKTGQVEGRVTLNGEPYTEADVILYSRDTGRAFNASIGSDGKFKVSEPVVVGDYLAFLAPKTVEVADGAPPPAVKIDKSIPAKYWNEASTDIQVTVTEGANQVQVPLVTR